MLLVKTKLAASSIEGFGLFADEFIPKGKLIWKLMPPFDLCLDQEEATKLNGPAQETFLKYSYIDEKTKKYILSFDNSRFVNHSSSPNTEETMLDGQGADIATRDIQVGEEITYDYRKFDSEDVSRTDQYIFSN